MTKDLDQLLGRLSDRAPHPGLDVMSMAVLERIAESTGPRHDPFVLASALAAVAAVGIGFASGAVEPAQAQTQVTGLDAGRSLAPSTLLGG